MIKTFKDKETEKIFHSERCKKFSEELLKRAYIKLYLLDSSKRVEDLLIPPSNHLEKLSGKRKGQWSIRINNQYRICFNYIDDDAYDVEIVDYH